MPDQHRVMDPRALRALAHPVRNRILTELSARGSLRAADIARELAIPANQASFHLRQLAKYGLVREAPDEARDRRDRVWRLVSEEGLRLNLGELEEAPGGRTAVALFRRQASAWAYAAVDRAFAPRTEKGVHVSTADHAVRLTAGEAAELAAELDAVVTRWTERTRGGPGHARDDGDDGDDGDDRVDDRRTYLVFRIVEPYPEDSGAGSGGA